MYGAKNDEIICEECTLDWSQIGHNLKFYCWYFCSGKVTVSRGCVYVENYDKDDYAKIMNKCRYRPHSYPPIRCVCDEELCNGGKIDAWAEELAANITKDAPTDAHIALATSDSLKSADPEMIVLLISVVITFML